MLTRGPAGADVLGTACSQVRWHDPPITSRSPCACGSRNDAPAAAPPHREGAGGAEADDRHHGVLGAAAADGVAVPGDAVGAVAVTTQPDGGEGLTELARVDVVEPPPQPRQQRGAADPRPSGRES